ncbi:hypothetical protein ACE6H2_000236 [Prunus campanulata]
MEYEVQVTPEVSTEFKPKLGLEFDSLEDALKMYNLYALKAGFGVRCSTTKTSSVTGEIIRKEFVCCKQGTTNITGKKRRRGWVRTGCLAKLAVLLPSLKNKYIVVAFKEEHNHEMTTYDQVHLLRCHRKVTESAKVYNAYLSKVNIPVHQQLSILEVQAGGMENIGFLRKDVYNYQRDMRAKVTGHDADLLNEHFLREQEKNASFYFKIEVDSEGRMGNVFWADARSRRAYGSFGDVVVFDTTFNTNRYGMVFAPLIGVNNHRQTILFGCAFLTSESTEAFIWLFEEFKKAMPCGAPKMIITDQDAAIAKAIAVSLPTTFHRYCIWHIMNKLTEKTGIGECFLELCNCIWDMDTKEEFDAKWDEVITNNGLKEHTWLTSIHALRENWVPSYVKHVFSAGMSSSQRAESCHSFFKQYINKNNTLMEFIVRFERALASQRHKELLADHVDQNEKPPTPFLTPMQLQMGGIYTRGILDIFEREDFESLLCFFEVIKEDDTLCTYKVIERVQPGVTRTKEIVHEKNIDQAFCSCRGFEFRGIPCRHIISFLRMQQVAYLPEKYILKRWMKSAKAGVVFDKDGKEVKDNVDGCILVKRSTLCKVAADLIDSALLYDEGAELLQKTFNDIRGKLISLVSSRAPLEEANNEGETSSVQVRIKDPNRVKSKGRPKRVKGQREKAAGRHKRRCTGCRKSDHDRRRCPRLGIPSSSPEADIGAPVTENMQPTQKTQNNESTQLSMAEAFMQEFDLMHGPEV